MSILDYPKEKCPTCKGDTWWYSIIEPEYQGVPVWICGVCHAPPSEKGVLKMRIMKGNVRLNQVREQIFANYPIKGSPERNEAFRQFGEFRQQLDGLVKQLKALDTNCLYIENKKKAKLCVAPELECMGCPNDYWIVKEVMDKDQKEHPEVWKE